MALVVLQQGQCVWWVAQASAAQAPLKRLSSHLPASCSIESFMTIHTGPRGTVGHYTTWECAVRPDTSMLYLCPALRSHTNAPSGPWCWQCCNATPLAPQAACR